MDFFKISLLSGTTFEGTDLWSPFPGYPAFGGQIAAQALLAAFLTVPEISVPNTLSVMFVSRCNSKRNVRYVVKKLRDGSIVDMRQVECYQDDALVSIMHASFSKPECNIHDYEGGSHKLYEDEFIQLTDYISKALNDGGKDQAEIRLKYQVLYENMLIILKVLDVEVGKENGDTRQIRIRIKEKPSDIRATASLITLVSDLLLVETALMTSNLTLFSDDLSLLTSVDHTIHFFNLEKEIEEYVYYIVRCVGIRNSKAICEGRLIHEDGTLICLTRQQGIFRVKESYARE